MKKVIIAQNVNVNKMKRLIGKIIEIEQSSSIDGKNYFWHGKVIFSDDESIDIIDAIKGHIIIPKSRIITYRFMPEIIYYKYKNMLRDRLDNEGKIMIKETKPRINVEMK